jgi:Retrotransposon gag protein
MAATALTTKSLGSAPEPFDGTTANAEAFWTNLANYYFLNQDLYSSTSKRIASALTHFKLSTSTGEWAKDRQQTALVHSPSNFGTWEAFQDTFKAHFIPVDAKLLSTQLLHTLKMNNKPFSEWYQEWSTHTNCSGANEETKMYAFRQNIPATLHQKLIGISPAPMTLQCLVKLAKEFDQIWCMYNNAQTPPSNSSFTRQQPNVRSMSVYEP